MTPVEWSAIIAAIAAGTGIYVAWRNQQKGRDVDEDDKRRRWKERLAKIEAVRAAARDLGKQINKVVPVDGGRPNDIARGEFPDLDGLEKLAHGLDHGEIDSAVKSLQEHFPVLEERYPRVVKGQITVAAEDLEAYVVAHRGATKALTAIIESPN